MQTLDHGVCQSAETITKDNRVDDDDDDDDEDDDTKSL